MANVISIRPQSRLWADLLFLFIFSVFIAPLQANSSAADAGGLYDVEIDWEALEATFYRYGTTPAGSGNIIYVKQDATGANDGSSWANAFADLRSAFSIDVVVPGDEIWVAAGVYKPVIPVDVDDVTEAERNISFDLINGVAVYGGFAGTEMSLDERDWKANVTVLSGDIDNNDIADTHGITAHPDDIVGTNSFFVVTAVARDETTILDGFVISAGAAIQLDGDDDHPCLEGHGAGMKVIGASPLLRNLKFTGNWACGGGGMMVYQGSSPLLLDISFVNNRSEGFFQFIACFGGGGMGICQESSPTLINVEFINNEVVGNDRGSDWGGGLAVGNNNSAPILINVSFIGNFAVGGGGGMVVSHSDPTLVNVTFSGNSTSGFGGGLYHVNSGHSSIRNSIFWNNQDQTGIDDTPTASIRRFTSTTTISIQNSLVQGCNPAGEMDDICGSDDGGNLPDADPLFLDTPDPGDALAASGDLRLRGDSPAVDAGNNQFINDIEFDLDSNPRIFGGTVDLGPYEAQYASLSVTVDGNGTIEFDPEQQIPRYLLGDTVILIASVATGWAFTGWSGDIDGDDNPLEITIEEDIELTAVFEPVEKYTLVVDMVGEGAVQIEPDQSSYHFGDEVTLTAVPALGWAFAGWSGDIDGDDNPLGITIEEDIELTAVFEPVEKYTLVVDMVGEGAVQIEPDQSSYHFGDEVILTAVPALGWAFTGWSGDIDGDDNPLQITIEDDVTLTANFVFLSDELFQDRFEEAQ